MTNDNAWFAALKERRDREASDQMAAAKAEAHAAGKEPFDLALLERLWPENPNARLAAAGAPPSTEARLKQWDRLYYVSYPAIRTTAEFVEKMRALQGDGFFD